MDFSKIKRGDILIVIFENQEYKKSFGRYYITFICNGEIYICNDTVKIGILAAIDLAGELRVCEEHGSSLVINIYISKDKVLKPTLEQYTELTMKLALNGYMYNKHTKKVKRYVYNKRLKKII